MNNQDIKIFQERDFGELVSVSISFFIQEIKFIIKNLMYFVGPFVLLSAVLSAAFNLGAANDFSQIFKMLQGNYVQPQQNQGGVFLIGILNLFQGIMTYTVLAVYVKLYAERGRGGFDTQDVWNEIKGNFWSVLGGQFLAGLMVVLGFVFLIIPGIYLLVVISFLFAIIVFENISVGESISRTFVLIKEHWWLTFGALIVMAILTSILTAVFTGAISMALIASTNSIMTSIISVIIGFGTLIISAASVLLPIFLYTSFVTEKENPTLLERITNINANKNEETNVFEEAEDNKIIEKETNEEKSKTSDDWEELLEQHKMKKENSEPKEQESEKSEKTTKTEENKSETEKPKKEKNRFEETDENDRFKPKY